MEFEYGEYARHSGNKPFINIPAITNSELFSKITYMPRQNDDILFGYFQVKEKDKNFLRVFQLNTINEKQGCDSLKIARFKQKEIECSFIRPYLIESKKKKLYKILRLYKKNNPKFEQLKDEVLLKQLHKEFINKEIISSKDEILSSNMYLALWFNAPISELARWQPQ